MNRRFLMFSLQDSGTNYFGLIICGAMFLCGCIIGTVSAGFVSDGESLRQYISSYVAQVSGETLGKPEFLSALFGACKYHLIAIFLGFSILGVICIPLLSAIRGFFLCFSISAFVRLFGSSGILLALSVFGTGTLITVPCYFILAVSSFSASLYLFRMILANGGRGALSPFGSKFFVRCGICFIILVLSALIETTLTSQLISYTASHLTI